MVYHLTALQNFGKNRFPFEQMVNLSRIDYAHKVVINRLLPPPVGDLQRTGQVQDAINFLSQQSSPKVWLPFSTIGIDVSYAQGTIDWNQVSKWRHWERGQHIEFAFIKATQGIKGLDPYFNGSKGRNWLNIKETSILRGPYHFFENSDGKLQAQHFFDTVVKAGGLTSRDLPPVIDFESYGSAKDKALDCLIETQRLFGRIPILYTYQSFYDQYLRKDSRFSRYPLWIAKYDYDDKSPKSLNPKAPSPLPKPFRLSSPNMKWTFWQFRVAPGGRHGWNEIAGIRTNIDLNTLHPSLNLNQVIQSSFLTY